MIVRRIARPMLASIFIAGGIDALRHPAQKAEAAQPGLDQVLGVVPPAVGDKLPADPETLVKINAAVQVGAGALLALGKAPRFSALALAATTVPTTVAGHDFWNQQDPALRAQHRTQFLKNVGLLGGLLLAAVDTEGKPSLGWRGRRAARRAQESVVSAFHSSESGAGDALHQVADRVKSSPVTERVVALTEEAAEQGGHLFDRARDRAPELADAARERGTELAEKAKDRVPEYAEAAQRQGAKWWGVTRDRSAELAERVGSHSAELAERVGSHSAELAERVGSHSAELAERAEGRGAELAKRVEGRSAELAKRAEAELAHRVGPRAAELEARALESVHAARARAEKELGKARRELRKA